MAEETNTTQDSAGKINEYELREANFEKRDGVISSVLVIIDNYYHRIYLKEGMPVENRSPNLRTDHNLPKIVLSSKHMIAFFPNKVEIYRC